MSTTNWSWPGARWWRCDLHVHTPASHDYVLRDEVTFEDWATGVIDSAVQVLAVTDHNTAHGIDAARAALAGRAHIFPGVELTVSPGVHLLALFDPQSGPPDVVALLAKCDVQPREFGDRDAVSPKSVLDAMEEAGKLGALCVLAHVDANAGVIKRLGSGETLRRILTSRNLAAVEVRNNNPDLLKYVDGRVRDFVPPTGRLTVVRSSDAHTPSNIGERTSWIKMTRPTLAWSGWSRCRATF